jgi:hypothetical protein
LEPSSPGLDPVTFRETVPERTRIMTVLTNVFPGDKLEDFRWSSAPRFLGPRQGDEARARMASFMDPVAPGMLARFDPG